MTRRIIPFITQYEIEQARIKHGLLFFVTISHEDLDRDVYLVTDGAPYVLDGLTYEKGWFELGLLTDDDKPPQTTFRFPNIDQRRMAMLENINGPARVDYRVISTAWFDLSKTPRTVLEGLVAEPVYTALYLQLTEVEVTDTSVEDKLMNFDPRSEIWPTGSVTEFEFPGAGYQ